MLLETYRIHHILRSDKKVHNLLTNCYSVGKTCLKKILNMKYKCEVQHRPAL